MNVGVFEHGRVGPADEGRGEARASSKAACLPEMDATPAACEAPGERSACDGEGGARGREPRRAAGDGIWVPRDAPSAPEPHDDDDDENMLRAQDVQSIPPREEHSGSLRGAAIGIGRLFHAQQSQPSDSSLQAVMPSSPSTRCASPGETISPRLPANQQTAGSATAAAAAAGCSDGSGPGTSLAGGLVGTGDHSCTVHPAALLHQDVRPVAAPSALAPHVDIMAIMSQGHVTETTPAHTQCACCKARVAAAGVSSARKNTSKAAVVTADTATYADPTQPSTANNVGSAAAVAHPSGAVEEASVHASRAEHAESGRISDSEWKLISALRDAVHGAMMGGDGSRQGGIRSDTPASSAGAGDVSIRERTLITALRETVDSAIGGRLLSGGAPATGSATPSGACASPFKYKNDTEMDAPGAVDSNAGSLKRKSTPTRYSVQPSSAAARQSKIEGPASAPAGAPATMTAGRSVFGAMGSSGAATVTTTSSEAEESDLAMRSAPALKRQRRGDPNENHQISPLGDENSNISKVPAWQQGGSAVAYFPSALDLLKAAFEGLGEELAIDEKDDTVWRLMSQLIGVLEYVSVKPTLIGGPASFLRDYLRTLLVGSASEGQREIVRREIVSADLYPQRRANLFNALPHELTKHILSFLDGRNMARARQVCQTWREIACDEEIWKQLCIKEWRSLAADPDAWPLANPLVSHEDPNRWRKIYPSLVTGKSWRCRLQKTGRFICHMIAHQVNGSSLGERGLPDTLVVERRFNILHLQTFVLPDAAVLYFEPESEADRSGFEDFIEYLTRRTRAGLALDEQRRFIFIPPCEYSKDTLNYRGKSLLGVVQNAFPPLQG
ncbi:Flowering time control protein FPA [Porphyridium purpureum]|uniref:Flowering time control protein FPA n=1 Tax=Porphyridium purpureum TaxID=35688 RepID=A0A5J4YZ77_PORPP|nr:Flowering time control protein FPA [Porphyridium purpureum]|eukprot:POR5592..scf208_2